MERDNHVGQAAVDGTKIPCCAAAVCVASPVVLVQKKDGSLRLLNGLVVAQFRDMQRCPSITLNRQKLEALGGALVFHTTPADWLLAGGSFR